MFFIIILNGMVTDLGVLLSLSRRTLLQPELDPPKLQKKTPVSRGRHKAVRKNEVRIQLLLFCSNKSIFIFIFNLSTRKHYRFYWGENKCVTHQHISFAHIHILAFSIFNIFFSANLLKSSCACQINKWVIEVTAVTSSLQSRGCWYGHTVPCISIHPLRFSTFCQVTPTM